MNINISVYADKDEAKLTGIYVDTNVGTDDLRWHERIMDVVESIAAELVEGIQDVIDNPDEEVPPLEPIPFNPIDPISVPKPVNPPNEEM